MTRNLAVAYLQVMPEIMPSMRAQRGSVFSNPEDLDRLLREGGCCPFELEICSG
jgi:hypothetical protein